MVNEKHIGTNDISPSFIQRVLTEMAASVLVITYLSSNY
jgi:hypothetical protein